MPNMFGSLADLAGRHDLLKFQLMQIATAKQAITQTLTEYVVELLNVACLSKQDEKTNLDDHGYWFNRKTLDQILDAGKIAEITRAFNAGGFESIDEFGKRVEVYMNQIYGNDEVQIHVLTLGQSVQRKVQMQFIVNKKS